MELNHLRHFYEVAKSGGFAKASQRLRIAQSALSTAVKQLEESGGVKLFERNRRGVNLTPIGQEIYAKCEELFEKFSEIEATCRNKQDEPAGPLKFGASDHVTKYLVVPKLVKFKQAYPRVEPSVFSAGPNEIVAAILNSEIEFGLFFTQIVHPQVNYEPVAAYPMAVVVHPSLARAGATPKQLAKEVGAIMSTQQRYSHNPSESAIVQLGRPPVNFELNSQEAQKQMCLEKGGVAVLARFVVEDELRQKRLTEVKIRNPLALKLYLASRSGRSTSTNARAFLNLLK